MKNIFFILLLSFVIFSACKKEDQLVNKLEDSKLKIVSVNYPLHYFAQRIGGNQIDTEFPLPTDTDPAYWQPDAADISVFQQADVIFVNGAGYAKWVDKVSLPTSRMINTSAGFHDKYVELVEGVTHSHGSEGDHVHRGYAFTTWLNNKLAIEQADVIKSKLIQILPGQKDYFEMNYQGLKTDLGILDQELSGIAKFLQNKTLFGSHPVYQYLANGYNLTIKSEHWEPDQLPSNEQWAVFKDKNKANPGNIMLWEGQPHPEVEKKLASLGILVVVFDPCANKPDSGDFLTVMKQNLTNLKAAL